MRGNLKEIRKLSVMELIGYSKEDYNQEPLQFFIPDYQRGYRWTKRQVEELLNDIKDFVAKEESSNKVYLLQPLVVREDEETYRVVDGQQRLTTIYLIMLYLISCDSVKNYCKSETLENFKLYSLTYETREGSKDFLIKPTDESKYTKNVDYYHIFNVYKAIEKWFGTDVNKVLMFESLLSRVELIWYPLECSDKSGEIHDFEKLNKGKIALTDSELVKGLFLNSANFVGLNDEKDINNKQFELSTEWEKIEYTLQDDAFWLFIYNKKDYHKPTRIDYFLEIISYHEYIQSNPRGTFASFRKEFGNEEYGLFLWFDSKFKDIYIKCKDKKEIIIKKVYTEKILKLFKELKDIYQILMEWYHDCYFFHYIGYLITVNNGTEVKVIVELLKEWNKLSKIDFRYYLESQIVEILKKDWIGERIKNGENWWEQEFEGKNPSKGKCKNLLLLHNIQTIVRQNDILINDDGYNLPNFTRFDFHLYKCDSWEVEHIRPNSGDNTKDGDEKIDPNKTRLLYLITMAYYLDDNDDLVELLDLFFDSIKKKHEMILESNPYKINDLAIKINYMEKDINKLKDYLDEEYLEIFESISGAISLNDEGEIEVTEVKEDLYDMIHEKIEADNSIDDTKKNYIYNYTLLDRKTNEEYGNHIFPVKRQFILLKEQGRKTKANNVLDYLITNAVLGDESGKEKLMEETEIEIAYVPPCTKAIFSKTYSAYPKTLTSWTIEDAKDYLDNMKELLNDFISKI